MAEIIKLTCPACGGKLELTEDIERFACSYCGNEHVVIRRGGIVSLKPVVEELEQVRVGTDRVASELALARLENEMDDLRSDLYFASRRSYNKLGLALICWLLAAFYFAFRYLPCAVPLLVLGIVFVGLWLWDEDRRSARRREIEPLLEAKRQEYDRNREIVKKT